MPYAANDELPPAVRCLPAHAQDVYREVFNHAWERYDGDPACDRIAWAAVENCYAMVEGVWERKGHENDGRARSALHRPPARRSQARR